MNWLKRQWVKFKAWIIALLITIGLLSTPLLMASPKTFTWTNPIARTDGSVYDALTEQQETRIYCDGATVADFTALGAATSVIGDLGFGSHTCHAIAVDIYGTPSFPSNTVTFVLTPSAPNPPTLSVN